MFISVFRAASPWFRSWSSWIHSIHTHIFFLVRHHKIFVATHITYSCTFHVVSSFLLFQLQFRGHSLTFIWFCSAMPILSAFIWSPYWYFFQFMWTQRRTEVPASSFTSMAVSFMRRNCSVDKGNYGPRLATTRYSPVLGLTGEF